MPKNLGDNSVTLTIVNTNGSIGAVCQGLMKTDDDWNVFKPTLDVGLTEFASNILPKITFDSEWNSKFWLGIENPLAPAQNDDVKNIFLEQLSSTIKAGKRLYNYLSKIGLSDILEKINSMPDNTFLTIVTNFAFIPWEILIANPQDDSIVAYKNLWGYRFVTNYELLHDQGGFSPPNKQHKNGKPKINLNLNPQINEDFKQSILL